MFVVLRHCDLARVRLDGLRCFVMAVRVDDMNLEFNACKRDKNSNLDVRMLFLYSHSF
jgi:hypothetical protein